MSKKLYDILFEDAAPAKRPDLAARLKKTQDAATPKRSPSGKIEVHPHQVLSAMQDQIEKEIPTITQIAKEINPSKDAIATAKKAIDQVDKVIDGIAYFQGDSSKQSQPQQPIDKPKQAQSSEPQKNPTVAKTQEVPQAAIEDAMRQQTKSQGANTSVPPANKPGLFNRLKQGAQAAKQRIGLEEAIKEAVKDGFKSR
jgi:tRNA U34 5-methylaminomethyl-2-thiouridine-forming methyltransferase MnmC